MNWYNLSTIPKALPGLLLFMRTKHTDFATLCKKSYTMTAVQHNQSRSRINTERRITRQAGDPLCVCWQTLCWQRFQILPWNVTLEEYMAPEAALLSVDWLYEFTSLQGRTGQCWVIWAHSPLPPLGPCLSPTLVALLWWFSHKFVHCPVSADGFK